MKFNYRHRWPKILVISFVILLVGLLGTVIVVRQSYLNQLKPLNSDQTSQLITISSGSSVHEIAVKLKAKGLIKSSWAFEWHVRSREARSLLQAGTYRFSSSQGIPAMVDLMIDGKIDTTTVTIVPGARLDQIQATFIKVGFTPADVQQAFTAAQYQNHPALADKPLTASLEGYLYPETFQKDTNTKPADTVRRSLDEMNKRLTPELKQSFVNQGLTTYQAVILASIVEQEVSKPEDRAQAAQVFLTRLKSDIPLGSDVTAFYGAIIAGQPKSVNFNSEYNTHLHKGLPPGPISNVTSSSLQAVARPASTNWLYFVSGDDGITYFSKTLEEHQNLTKQHCKKLCGQ